MTMVGKKRGRRPGHADTKQAILDAALSLFSQHGYDKVSLRSIARAAEVDPSLVAHYFGTKLDLFLAVVELPIDPAALIDRVVGGGPDNRDGAGVRLAAAVLDVLDDEVRRRPVVGMIRAATSEPEAARLVRDFLTRDLLLPIAQRLEADHPEYRAGLVMSQIVGFTLARYIVGIEPLATHPRELVAADLGATLQRYLLGELSR